MPRMFSTCSPVPITIDTREQLPYGFAGLPVVSTVSRLDEGDYGLTGQDALPASQRIVIERKSLADLYGSVGRGHARFKREAMRLSAYGFPVILVEAELSQIMQPNDHLRIPTRVSPRTAVMTLLSWSMKYGIHVWPVPGREAGERVTFRMIQLWRNLLISKGTNGEQRR